MTTSTVTEIRRNGNPVGERIELARYSVPVGERVLYGQRVNGVVRVTDVPVAGRGRAYLVERELEQDGYAALNALALRLPGPGSTARRCTDGRLATRERFIALDAAPRSSLNAASILSRRAAESVGRVLFAQFARDLIPRQPLHLMQSGCGR